MSDLERIDEALPPPEGDGTKDYQYRQTEVGYTPLSLTAGEACANCRWFTNITNMEYPAPTCRIVQQWPQDILATGWCDRHDDIPALNEYGGLIDTAVDSAKDAVDAVVQLEVTDAPVSTSGTRGIIGTIKALFNKPEPLTGFKVYGNHFLGTFSNNFEDREGEIFTAKAIDDYIGRLDSGIVPQPELWVWHKGGSVRIGQALTTFRVGAFVVSAGEFDSTPTAQHAKEALVKEKDLGMSHGFTYNPAKFDGRHYNEFNTFEISVLPRKAAANLFTTFEEIKTMAMTKEQRDFIARITGKPADELEKSYEEATKALEATGLAYKDFTAVPDDEPAVSEKTIAEASKAFGALVTDLTESQGELANMQLEGAKALTAFKSDVDARLTAATKAISDLTALVTKLAGERPRVASQDEDNTIESAELSKQIAAALDDESNYETVAGIRVRKMQR